MNPKKITSQTVLGQRGINLIESRLLEMGFVWYPTGGVEAGIDGHLEIRDSSSGEVLNAIVRVQSKATTDPLGRSGSEMFEYPCNERDIDYWMMGNAPVILVRSRPDTREAYWISIKEYFKDPSRRSSHAVQFDKRRDSFDLGAKQRLIALAIPKDRGVYFAPRPSTERLVSNLLPITISPAFIYHAPTQVPSVREIARILVSRGSGIREWILKGGEVLSFHDLRAARWADVCDPKTVAVVDATQWSSSRELQRQQEYVWLLNQCLRAVAQRLGLRYDSGQDCFYFTPSVDLKRRRLQYQASKKEATRTVFQVYRRKTSAGGIAYCRHTAFHGQFRRYGERWFFEIVPTYFFTLDGYKPHSRYESKLKGIKALERNDAVRNHVVMWADLLCERTDDLFKANDQRLLQFGSLVSVEVNVGFDDQAWISTEGHGPGSAEEGGGLFDDEV